MLEFVDNFLNKITMYRLILYYLAGLLAAAALFGFFGLVPFSPLSIIFSTAVFVFVSWVTNEVFSRVFGAQPNVESVYITAFILSLIIDPVSPGDLGKIIFFIWAAIWAIASKYIIAAKKKHIFNPAAFAVVLTAFTINQAASWWVSGSLPLMIFVVLGGLLAARKMRRFDLVLPFFAAAFLTAILSRDLNSSISTIQKVILHTPVFFFAFAMLTEPLTTPPTRRLRVIYGVITGFLFSTTFPIAGIYFTPELSLLAGNIFSYAVSHKKKYVLRLSRKEQAAEGVYDFVFDPGDKVVFHAGQYMEWTLGHYKPDSRGNRRYFTIASSPTENEIRLGVKFYSEPSTFKKRMMSLVPGDEMVMGQLAGDFTLTSNQKEKLAFLAGGIGVTPFRSMAKYLSDKGEKRDIVLLYSNKTPEEIAYKNVFDEAAVNAGMRTVYVLTAPGQIPAGLNARGGMINGEMIKIEIPDYMERTFYISGPHGMVAAMENALREIGVKGSRIKTDYFPGFA